MGYYTDLFNSGNSSGSHSFPGEFFFPPSPLFSGRYHLNDPAGFPHPDGRLLEIRRDSNNEVVLFPLLLHQNGRPDGRPNSEYTGVARIGELKDCPEDLQDGLELVEHKPGGLSV
jgi:hypothetical protein